MNLTTKTQKQLAAVEAHDTTCVRVLITLAECLNRAHADFWAKSDDELQDFLQALLDNNNLVNLFEDHEFYATTTNNMLQRYGVASVCKTGVLKPFTIENGLVVITQPVVIEPDPEVIIEHVTVPEPEVIIEEPINELT